MNISHPNQREPELKSAALSSAVTRWVVIPIVLAMLCPGFGTCLGAETPALKEHGLKAAFLYNFTKFVEWPANSFRDANEPFVVAVAGNSPCTAELEKIAKERKVNGRDLIIKTVTTCEAARDAHVLFIFSSEDPRLKDWFAAVRGRSVLTIGESELFGKQGGIINFALEGEKIRFDLNIEQAEAAGLRISAQLQKRARTGRRKS
jgi:hypothetical protein